MPRLLIGSSLKMYFGRARTLEWTRAVAAICADHPAVRELAVPGSRGQDGGAVLGGESDRAAEEVGVQVGVRGVGDTQTAWVRRRAQAPQVQAGIDRERPAVAEVEQVGGVAQPVVDEWDHF